MGKSKGDLEAEISNALTHWEKSYLGRGSLSVKSDILRDMIIVTLRGILTPAEYSLCSDKDGLLSVKKHRNGLVESGLEDLKEIINNINHLDKILHAIKLSKKMNKVVKQNIVFAISVIVLLIISNFFEAINLPFGVVGHEGSTILVILNGLRLLRGNM